MAHALRIGFVAKADPDDPHAVIYTASVADLVHAGERDLRAQNQHTCAPAQRSNQVVSVSPILRGCRARRTGVHQSTVHRATPRLEFGRMQHPVCTPSTLSLC